MAKTLQAIYNRFNSNYKVFKMSTSKIKKVPINYLVFLVTLVVTILINALILKHKLDLQQSDAQIINLAGKQRMLSQAIAKNLVYAQLTLKERTADVYDPKNIGHMLEEFLISHQQLIQSAAQQPKIKEALLALEPTMSFLEQSANETVYGKKVSNGRRQLTEIASAEQEFLVQMDAIVSLFQQDSEQKLASTQQLGFWLSAFLIGLLIAEFFIIILPFSFQLDKKNKMLEHINKRLSDYAYITSHNLRAPVSNLNGLLYIFKTTTDEEEKNVLMQKFDSVLLKLNETLQTLIEAIRTQENDDIAIEELELNEILTTTENNLCNEISSHEAQIIPNFQDFDKVSYNRMFMESIFQNLISNSLKYKSDHERPIIQVEAKIAQGKKQLVFKDNGKGIDLNKHGKKIFGLNKTFHRHPDARGIGLFMTRNQIESLGGSINVESTVDQGTTFTITI